MNKRKPNAPMGRERKLSPPPLIKARPVAESRGVWLHGSHAVFAALNNPERRCHRLLATPASRAAVEEALARRGTEEMLSRRGGTSGLQVDSVERQDIESRLPPGAVHQGVALLADPLESPTVDDLTRMASARDASVLVVLDQVTDPRNIGAVLRSAAAFGALGVIVQDRHAPEETGTLAKAASGALERVPLVRAVNLSRALEELKTAGFWCLGLDTSAPGTLAKADLSGKIALVLGSEGQGLRRMVREHCDSLVRLPMTGAVESLNVATAAAVALYEATRGRLDP